MLRNQSSQRNHTLHIHAQAEVRDLVRKKDSVLPTIHYLSSERREQLNTLLKGEYFSLVPQTMKVHVFPRAAAQLKWE